MENEQLPPYGGEGYPPQNLQSIQRPRVRSAFRVPQNSRPQVRELFPQLAADPLVPVNIQEQSVLQALAHEAHQQAVRHQQVIDSFRNQMHEVRRQRQERHLRDQEIEWNELRGQHQEENRRRLEQLQQGQQGNQLLLQQQPAQAGIPHNLLLGQQPSQNFMNYGILMPQQLQLQLQNQFVVQQHPQPVQPAMTIDQFQQLLRQQPLEMQIQPVAAQQPQPARAALAVDQIIQLMQQQPLGRWMRAVMQAFENNRQGYERFLEIINEHSDRYKNLCQNGATSAEIDSIFPEHIEKMTELLYGAPNLVLEFSTFLPLQFRVGINAEGRYFYTRPNAEPKVIMSPEERRAQREAEDEDSEAEDEESEAEDEESEAEDEESEAEDQESEAEVEEPELENLRLLQNEAPAQAGGPVQPAPDANIHLREIKAEPEEEVEPEEPVKQLPGMEDTLLYLREVKKQMNNPQSFNEFVTIMRDLRAERISPLDACEQVIQHLHAHPNLVDDFNAFLPYGFGIDATVEDRYSIISSNQEPKVVMIPRSASKSTN